MKLNLKLIICSIILIAFRANANEFKMKELGELLPQDWSTVSIVKDKSVHKDSVLVTGNVKMFSSANPIERVKVGSTRSGKWTSTDENGYFEVLIGTGTDEKLYFYKKGWTEVVIENYDFKGQHKMEVMVFLHQIRPADSQPVKRKPVIYLYAEKELTASIKINPYGNFTFTYPFYNDGWNVTVHPDGSINDNETGIKYPYLFWEAKSEDLFYAYKGSDIEGFVINTDTTISFLENVLTQIGFNSYEQTDFITYWGPILEQKKYAFVQFRIDQDYDQEIADLNVDPKPDAMKRVYIICSGLDDPSFGMNVIPQKFESFERKGFTLVEWGGSTIDIYDLKP